VLWWNVEKIRRRWKLHFISSRAPDVKKRWRGARRWRYKGWSILIQPRRPKQCSARRRHHVLCTRLMRDVAVHW
jgi:hypothetical protein